MIVLTDTDVVLDLLLDREPFSTQAAVLFGLIEQGKIQGLVAATTVTTIHYLAGRAKNKAMANQAIGWLLQLMDVAQVNRHILEAALESGFTDFEDSVVHEAGRAAGADCIVTRNLKDYKKAQIPVYSPTEFLKALEVQSRGSK